MAKVAEEEEEDKEEETPSQIGTSVTDIVSTANNT